MDCFTEWPSCLQFFSVISESAENEFITWSQGSTAIEQCNGQTEHTVHPQIPVCIWGVTERREGCRHSQHFALRPPQTKLKGWRIEDKFKKKKTQKFKTERKMSDE